MFNGAAMISDAQLAAIKTPTWIVQSKDDPVLPFAANGQHMAATIPGARLTAYDNVTWDVVAYNGHWSWIYVARNDPRTDSGLHIWQWMAKQHRAPGIGPSPQVVPEGWASRQGPARHFRSGSGGHPRAGEARTVGVDVKGKGAFSLPSTGVVPEVDVGGPDGSGEQAAVGIPVEDAAEDDIVAV